MRLVALSLAAALCASLSACSAAPDEEAPAAATTSERVQEFDPNASLWGVHTRVSAARPDMAEANVRALDLVLRRLQGTKQRLAITDQVTTGGGACGSNGSIDSGLDQWHCDTFHRILLPLLNAHADNVVAVVRIDCAGMVNVDPKQPDRLAEYKASVQKFISYFQTYAPRVPLEIIVGNEPDLAKERQSWSWGPQGDGNLEERKGFVVGELAPLVGQLVADLAKAAPNVQFITPALSGDMNAAGATPGFASGMFGGKCPKNVLLGLHGYAGDNAEGGSTEQRARAMKTGTCRVAGTEIGSSPYDSNRMVRSGILSTGVAWIFLSQQHLSTIASVNPHEDNAYVFSADANGDENQASVAETAGYVL
jgi:hypothetical protein